MPYKAYRMLRDSTVNTEVKAGATVYDCKGWDYGVANDDTRMTGVAHQSVTLDPEGGYPSFTVPVRDLEPIGEPSDAR